MIRQSTDSLKIIRILQCCSLLKKTQASTVPWKTGTTWLHLLKCNHSVICSLHFTLVLQQETKQVLGCTGKSVASRPRRSIPLPTHPAFPRSCLQQCLCLWAPQYKTPSDLLQHIPLRDKKRPRQPGWFSLKRRRPNGKILLESSSTYLQHAEEAELGSPKRQGTNAAAWKILLLLRSFQHVW